MVLIFLELMKYINTKLIPYSEEQTKYTNRLVSNYEEIEFLLKEKNGQILKLLYFNKENISDILYTSNKLVAIDHLITKKLSDLFYLDLLLTSNPNVIDYIFTKNTLINLCEELLNVKNGIKKVIIHKIIYDLLESYHGFVNNDYSKKSLKKIKDLYEKEINNQTKIDFDFWNGIDIDNIMSISIDELYSYIIVNLFTSDNYSYEYILSVLKDLELEDIDITENIYLKLLNYKEKFESVYSIKNIQDLINVKKINFYYLLLKYILKAPLFIYQFDFLLSTRNLLISIINNNLYTLLELISDVDPDSKKKLDYIIKVLTDSDFYFEKYEEMKKSKIIINIIKDKRFRYAFPLMKILFDLKVNEMEFNENYLNSLLDRWTPLYNCLKKGKFKKIKHTQKKKLFSFLKNQNNKKLLLKIFNKSEYESFQELDINAPDESIIENDDDNKDNYSVIQEGNNIVVNEVNENMLEINEDKFNKGSETSIMIQSLTIQSRIEPETEIRSELININYKCDFKQFQKSDKYKIIDYYKSLKESKKINNSYFHYTKNLSKGHYLISGNSHLILIYNANFEKKLEFELNSKPKNIYEISNNKNQSEELTLLACCRKEIVVITIDTNNYKYDLKVQYERNFIDFNSWYNLDDKYLICGVKGGFFLENSENFCKIRQIFETNYINGINLKKKIFAFSSNKLLPNGENKLLIYDFQRNKILKEILNDSLKISNNGLNLINLDKIQSINTNREILLCSCSSREKGKNGKNGFLMVDMCLDKNEFLESFYETQEFEAHCFCQLSVVTNNNSVNDDISKGKNIDIKETEYFLVGGFDLMKRIGCVKLYQLKYDKDNNKINIRYLIDMATENVDEFRGFGMEVSCITQSRITGNLLITCLDGNIYLFKPPNLELFL